MFRVEGWKHKTGTSIEFVGSVGHESLHWEEPTLYTVVYVYITYKHSTL